MAKEWKSNTVVPSAAWPGVEFVITRMSFGRRLELMRLIRDLAARAEFLEAGESGKDRMDASLLGAEIDRLYVEWGVEAIHGINFDANPATAKGLIDLGPEDLFREALAAVKAESGLNEAEKKTDSRFPFSYCAAGCRGPCRVGLRELPTAWHGREATLRVSACGAAR